MYIYIYAREHFFKSFQLRKHLKMHLPFYGGLCSVWMITSKLWERDKFGCPGKGLKNVFGSASNLLQLGVISPGSHAYRMHAFFYSSSRPQCIHACMQLQEGCSALNAFAVAKKWKLFKVKPKIHMQQEIEHLSCIEQNLSNILAIYIFAQLALRLFMFDQLQRGAQHILNPNCCLHACMHVHQSL